MVNKDSVAWNPRSDKRPLSDKVYDWLRKSIITLKLLPGSMLSESNLAAQLSISRTPVREALIRLGQQGLVEILAQRGSRVAAISSTAVDTSRFVRLALEQAIAEDISKKGLKPSVYFELQSIIYQQKEANNDNNLELFMDLDDNFHQKLAIAAGREDVWNFIERKKAQMDRVSYLVLDYDNMDVSDLIKQHEFILNLINDGQTTHLKEAFSEHYDKVLEGLQLIPEKYPDYFEE